ncbi:MAG: hypothetical protein PHS60_17665 [Zavarzinia sp.]|nr:hypothetical protein [Zavarzinia sp.]
MTGRQPDETDPPDAGRPESSGAEIIPFRPRRQQPDRPAPGAGRGRVFGPRSRIATRLRGLEALCFGFLFGLVALFLKSPAQALPYIALGFVIAMGCWFAIAPRRGTIDNGTIFVAALAAALAGWFAYALIESLRAGGGALTVFQSFVGGIAYAMVVAWPVGIAAGVIVRKLSSGWRPSRGA